MNTATTLIGTCITVPGPRNPKGYMQGSAHRVVWMLKHGAIPDGMTLDHVCRRNDCLNTEHMELVTRGENTRRAWARAHATGDHRIGGGKRWVTHCPQGHPYNAENTYWHPSCGRGCRVCRKAATAKNARKRIRRKS